MSLQVGNTYIRNDFLYSAIILEIVKDIVTYEFQNIEDGYKSKWSVNSTQFRNNYYPATDLLTALF